jgi:hypothetical protein
MTLAFGVGAVLTRAEFATTGISRIVKTLTAR